MQSEAEATRESKTLRGQNLQYAPMSKQPYLTGFRAPFRLSSRVHIPSNTPPERFLHSVAGTEDPQSTPAQKGKAPQIQIMEPTLMKLLGRLSADPVSGEQESQPKDEPESEPASPYAETGTRHLQSTYQKVYPGKDPKDFADGWQGFAEITAPMHTSAKTLICVPCARGTGRT